MAFDVFFGGEFIGSTERVVVDVPASSFQPIPPPVDLAMLEFEADLVEEIILGLGIPPWLFKAPPPVPLLVLPHLSFPQEGM